MGHDIRALRKFIAPEFVFGNGSRFLAAKYAKNFAAKKIFVATDKSIIAAGWTIDVVETFREAGIEYVIFDSISPNPRDFEVENGKQMYLEENCDVIVAVGGGSVIDCAKGIGIAASNGGYILDYEGVDKIKIPMPPLIAIPTTAGTSADVSQFSIITDTKEKVKIAIISKSVIPDIALIDPETLMTMSPYLTACTAMDALTHAFEAFVSTASSPITDVHAIEAVKLISDNIRKAILNPSDKEVKEKLMLGSLEAGLAFSNAILGTVHSMAHSLGGYLDLPHGECNSILLRHVIDYNFDSEPERYGKLASVMGINIDKKNKKEIKNLLLEEITKIKNDVGIKNTLGNLGVTIGDIGVLSRNALKDPCNATNPRMPNIRDIEVLYEEAL